MFRSCAFKLRTTLRGALVCGLLLAATPQIAWADPPAGVVRTFAVEFGGPQPDFLAPDSLCVVVAPADPFAAPSFLRFTDQNSDLFFDSTVWEHRPAMHVHVGGAEIPGFVTWLVTDDTPTAPPTGATTFTGPYSMLILHQEVVYIKQCTSTTCLCDDWAGKVRIGSAQDNDGKLVVVTALFSR